MQKFQFFMPFCNQNGILVSEVRKQHQDGNLPFWLQKGMKICKKVQKSKVWALSFPKTVSECFFDPQIRIYAGICLHGFWSKKAKIMKNRILGVGSNSHKNRSSHRKHIPRTFLESLGSILCICKKILIFYAFLQPERYP